MALPEMLRRARSARGMKDLMGLFRAQIYHPKAGDMRKWMAHAEIALEQSRRSSIGVEPIVAKGQAVEIYILCVFELPRGKVRKRSVPPRVWQTSHSAGDFDNLAKPICDAATEILWHDDSQVARAIIEKVVGAQGEAPRMEIMVRPVFGSPHRTLFEGELLAATVAAGDPPPSNEVGNDASNPGWQF